MGDLQAMNSTYTQGLRVEDIPGIEFFVFFRLELGTCIGHHELCWNHQSLLHSVDVEARATSLCIPRRRFSSNSLSSCGPCLCSQKRPTPLQIGHHEPSVLTEMEAGKNIPGPSYCHGLPFMGLTCLHQCWKVPVSLQASCCPSPLAAVPGAQKC